MGVQQKLMRHAHISTTMDQYGNASALAKREANRLIVQRLLQRPATQQISIQLQLSCIDWEGANETGGTGTLKNNQATIVFTGGTEDWACGLSYNGDSEFAPSGVSWWLNLCHGSVGACHP